MIPPEQSLADPPDPAPSFEQIVADHYEGLYRFGLSLTAEDADARDLVQHTFLTWAQKGDQLRDGAKAKSWLYTTLHRAFLNSRRRTTRFPHNPIEEAEAQLPPDDPVGADELDGRAAIAMLARVEEPYRSALALFYLEDQSYREIAEILEVAPGTVMSRLSRGKEILRKLFAEPATH